MNVRTKDQLEILKYFNSPSHADLKVKALEDGSVYLEGWANKAVVDRGKDLIPKGAWKLDDYKKNSIMLFNHDHSQPIGKMISVEAKDEGLFVKGRISNSKDPTISRIRDLVKEGILNSLSVGIIVDDEDYKDGVNHVKSAALHEVSIVAVPMNQESQFTVSAKSMSGPLIDNMEMIAHQVGYKDVEKACQILHSHADLYDSVDAIAEQLSIESGIEKEKAMTFMRMQSETPDKIKTWLQKECEQEEEVKAVEGKEVQAIKVPKSAFATMEELQKWATESGWSAENIAEDGDNYLLVQKPGDQFNDDLTEVDMGDGVTAFVGTLKDDPGTEEEPEEDEEEDAEAAKKGLLDGTNPVTQPISGNDASNSEVNPSLDQAKQTNVLLANVVMLLQQLNGKIDSMHEPKKPEMMPNDQNPNPSMESMTVEADLAKKIESFMIKTTERLSKLGL